MRYYIETYTEKGTDFFCIKPTTKDFEEYLSYKLEKFPQYIAPITHKKWLGTKILPELVTTRFPASEKLRLFDPIEVPYGNITSKKEKQFYHNTLMSLLMEWLADYETEFQTHWKNLSMSY
ncbi:MULTISPECIES: hypothetical protein [Planococcus]|uniref:hypothetical protein n=1 Tax=Planococcus TaxID=1372 RepID=UPI001B8CA3B4|nr:hypothetical protein [Planococcus sp. MSAK28401]